MRFPCYYFFILFTAAQQQGYSCATATLLLRNIKVTLAQR